MTLTVVQLVLAILATAGCAGGAAWFGATYLGKRRCFEMNLELQTQVDGKTVLLDQAKERFKEVNAHLEKAISDRNQLAEWATGTKEKMAAMKKEVAKAQSQVQETVASAKHVNSQLQQVIAERDQLAAGKSDAGTKISAMKDEVTKAHGQVKETVEKATQLANTVHALRAEREETKAAVTRLQKALVAINQRMQLMQQEFDKAGEFYKRELEKSLKTRQRLEQEVAQALKDREEFHSRLRKNVEDQGSEKEMIEVMQVRVGQVDLLERNNKKLRSEKKDLYEEINQLREEVKALKAEVTELEQFRIHNQQLVQAVEMLEQSRAHHAQEAEHYKDEADQLSASLKMKLSDIEESFAAMEQEQTEAIRNVRDAAASAQDATSNVPTLVNIA